MRLSKRMAGQGQREIKEKVCFSSFMCRSHFRVLSKVALHVLLFFVARSNVCILISLSLCVRASIYIRFVSKLLAFPSVSLALDMFYEYRILQFLNMDNYMWKTWKNTGHEIKVTVWYCYLLGR